MHYLLQVLAEPVSREVLTSAALSLQGTILCFGLPALRTSPSRLLCLWRSWRELSCTSKGERKASLGVQRRGTLVPKQPALQPGLTATVVPYLDGSSLVGRGPAICCAWT